MKNNKRSILVIDDDVSHLGMLETVLQGWGHTVLAASDPRRGVEIGSRLSSAPDLALVDMRMPGLDGLETMKALKQAWPELPVVIMTGYSEVADAVKAIQQGAKDYLPKPLDLPRLKKLLGPDSSSAPVGGGVATEEPFIGSDPAINSMLEMLKAVAPTEATVLVTGPSGTGKEVVAKELHRLSGRQGQFIGINCGAFSPQLLESELFGHEKGAFTGADKAKSGILAEAAGGTLFLDEIGEMPLNMQVKLLRVLQEREFRRVGGQKNIPFTGRVAAATNRILEAEVAAGRFREDLFYRLNVVRLELPPLKDRKGDIPWLATKFAQKFAARDARPFKGVTDDAMRLLCAYSWPGNIRELENVMERATILMAGEYITPRLLPDVVAANKSAQTSFEKNIAEKAAGEAAFIPATLQEMERETILKTLAACGQNKSEAAKVLGISRKTLHTKLQAYEKK